MRVLLTGFEPFGAYRVNPSLLVAERLGGVVLPVSTTRLAGELERAIEEARPEVVLGVGLAAVAASGTSGGSAARIPGRGRLPLTGKRRCSTVGARASSRMVG